MKIKSAVDTIFTRYSDIESVLRVYKDTECTECRVYGVSSHRVYRVYRESVWGQFSHSLLVNMQTAL